MADRKKKVDLSIPQVNAKVGAVLQRVKNHLPSAGMKTFKSNRIPSESSFTDSSMIITRSLAKKIN